MTSSENLQEPDIEAVPSGYPEVSEPNRAAVLGAAAALAVGGAAVETARVDAHPLPPKDAIVQSVGNQQVSSEKFLQSGRVSAETLLGMHPSKAAHNSQALSTEKAPDPGEYSVNYLRSIEAGKTKMGFFNGVVTIDCYTHIYEAMDPSFRPGTKNNSYESLWPYWHAQPNHGQTSSKGKFGAGSYPAIMFDQKGGAWLSFSIETKNSNLSGSSLPMENQAILVNLFFIPLNKQNSGHVHLYKVPGPTILPGGISSTTKNFIDYSTKKMLPPNELASWDTYELVEDTGTGGKTQWDGTARMPAMMPNSQLKYFVPTDNNHKPYKQYKVPSSKTLKKMVALANPAYTGND